MERVLGLPLGLAASLVVLGSSRAYGQSDAAQELAHPPPPLLEPLLSTRPPAMSIRDALAYAHTHHPAIRAALARVVAERAAARIASGQWWPTVGVTGQIFAATANNTTAMFVQSEGLNLPRIGATRATSSGSLSPVASTLVGAGFTQEVFDFGRIGAERAAADALAEGAGHRSEAELLDVDFGVEEAFFAVAAAKSIVQAADEAYDRSLAHRDLAKRGVDSGLRPPIELTRAEADLTRFDIGRVRSRGGLVVAQTTLAASIGSPEPAIDIADAPPKAGEMPALAEALSLAQSRDPRLAETLSELKAAEDETRAEGAKLRPDLSLTATVSGRAGGAPPSSGPSATSGGWVPNVPNWDAGLVLSWPLFDGTVAARRDASQAREQVRRDEVDLVLEEQAATVRRAYIEVEIARSSLAALGRAVAAAHSNYDQADARFRSGLGTAVELADSEAIRTDAEIQLALGQFEVARSRAAFGRAIAEGL